MGDGKDLIAFYLAILKGDAKALGVRQIRLQDRMEAAQWLAERGWGRAPLVADADFPEEPQVNFYDALGAWARSLPPNLREMLGAYVDQRFIEAIEADIAVVDEQIKATMPDGWSPVASSPTAGRADESPRVAHPSLTSAASAPLPLIRRVP